MTAQVIYAQPSREIDRCLPNSPFNQWELGTIAFKNPSINLWGQTHCLWELKSDSLFYLPQNLSSCGMLVACV